MILRDPITRVLLQAEALETLARLLSTEQGGLAHLLELVAAEAKASGEELDEKSCSPLTEESGSNHQ